MLNGVNGKALACNDIDLGDTMGVDNCVGVGHSGFARRESGWYRSGPGEGEITMMRQNAEVNAQLGVAAPDLLAALNRALHYLTSSHPDPSERLAVISEARAAINLAVREEDPK